MKISLSKSKSIDLDPRKSLSSIGALWMRAYRYIFSLLFFIILGWGAWIGYQNLFNFEWSQERKDAYIATERRKFEFQQERFNSVVENIEERLRTYEQAPQGISNPFYDTGTTAVESSEESPKTEDQSSPTVFEEETTGEEVGTAS